jgi:carbamoyl-phosphate synthase small subunit
VNPEDEESARPFLGGFVVKELFQEPSNWRAREPLDAYLRRHGVPGIAGIDTRALVRRIRDGGFQMGVLCSDPERLDAAALVEQARSAPGLDGRDLAAEVTCSEAYTWTEGRWQGIEGQCPRAERPMRRYKLVAYDFGIKRNILRRLVEQGFEVTVVPAQTSAEEALAFEPDAIFLSNGPGDPAGVASSVRETVRRLADEKPIFGICLGHQILGLALGGDRIKLKFGHHGGNQPGQDLETKKVAICAENHGYAVDAESLRAAGEPVEITHVNLNDGTVEGLAHKTRPLFSVQYHPEASPGPHDAAYFFQRFRELVARHEAGEPVTGAQVASGRESGGV